MKRKKWLIILLVIAVVGISGYFGVKYYLVNYAFDKYVLRTAMDVMQQAPATTEPSDSAAASPTPSSAEGESGTVAAASASPESTSPAPAKKTVSELSKSEVATVVSRTPQLMSKLESIVSHGDKQQVINILMSNFTQEEIAQYSKKVASGLTAADKSELMSIARSRVTSAQWSECMQLFYKYIDELKPYIDESMIP